MNNLWVLSILPGVAIAFYIYWRDKHEKEPHLHLILCFIFGMVSTYPAIKMEEFGIYQLGILPTDLPSTAVFSFCVIAFSEEFVKYAFLKGYIYNHKTFNEPLDGIVYAVMISMGFATLENILYVVIRGGGEDVAYLRMFTAVPAHAAFAVAMGYFVGLAKFHKTSAMRWVYSISGLVVATIIHGFYDFFLFQQMSKSLAIFTLLTLVGGIIMSFIWIKRHAKDSPFNDEVA